MKDFAELLSSEQVERVMQRVQDAYKGERLPGLEGAHPSSAPMDYVQAHFVKHLKDLFTQTRSSAPNTPDSTGSKSASPWIWGTPDRRKEVKRDKFKAEEEWFSAAMLLSEEVTNIDGAQFVGILLNHDVTLSRQVNSIDVKAEKLSGSDSWCTSNVSSFLCSDDTAPIQVT